MESCRYCCATYETNNRLEVAMALVILMLVRNLLSIIFILSIPVALSNQSIGIPLFFDGDMLLIQKRFSRKQAMRSASWKTHVIGLSGTDIIAFFK